MGSPNEISQSPILAQLNHREVVKQLKKAAKQFGHVGNLFVTGDRVFFRIACSQELENLFNHRQLHQEFNDKFEKLQAIVTQENIQLITESMINYFFGPIEQSEAWVAFFTTQSEIITKESTNPEQEIASIRNRIAGAVVYKLMSSWRNNLEPRHEEKIRGKIIILTTILNHFNSPTNTLEQQKTNTSQEISNQMLKLITKLIINQATPESIAKEMDELAESIRHSDAFQALPGMNEKLLLKQWPIFMKNLIESKQETITKQHLNKIARAILKDLRDTHNKTLRS